MASCWRVSMLQTTRLVVEVSAESESEVWQKMNDNSPDVKQVKLEHVDADMESIVKLDG